MYLHPVMVEDSGIVNTSLVTQANMNFNRVIATLGEQTLENRIKIENDVDCIDSNITICKRTVLLPETVDGTVKTRFKWNESGMVSKLQKGETVKVITQTPHSLTTGNIIALCSKKIKPHAIDWMLADGVDEDGNRNGFQFKVKVVDDYCFELYELVSSAKPTLPCRHIHHINTLKDGWIIVRRNLSKWMAFVSAAKKGGYLRYY